ncbi:unnamed protein product [Moneuplotes crassus]|uniref:BZIP domain-containing protein n=1 Tax=Euplotes crassus TaxID=5936 RepID=A0AAD1XLW1_EUPCR|nr:unnamed protein product [Moneuplotes crassus]
MDEKDLMMPPSWVLDGQSTMMQSQGIDDDSVEHLRPPPSASRREKNKFYAMQNRRRKKEYIKELESKVETLQQKVADLNDKLDMYKNKMFSIACGGEAHFTDFESLRETWRYKIEDLVNSKEQKDHFKTFEEIKDSFGPMGTARRLMLKKCFRTVIENLVPDHIKLVMFLAPKLSSISDEEYDKLFALPKPAALHKLKTEAFSDADKSLYDIGIRGNLRKVFTMRSSLLSDIKTNMKTLVRQLILIQNQIFKEQDRMKMFRKSVTEMDSQYESIPKLLAHFKTVESDPQYSIFNMWEIKKKSEILPNETVGEVCLSDYDI